MLKALCFTLALGAPAVALAQPQILSNPWDSDRPSEFTHVLQGRPGARVVRIDAIVTAGEPATVSVYPRRADGGRAEPRLLTASATRAGDSRAFPVELPPTGRLPVVVLVENASGRRSVGEYTLTVAP